MVAYTKGVAAVGNEYSRPCFFHHAIAETVMKRISIGTLLVLLAVACFGTVPIYPAKAQSLTPTGLDKNGLSALGLKIMRTPVRPVANPA